jgi:two-component system LytT family response regulator
VKEAVNRYPSSQNDNIFDKLNLFKESISEKPRKIMLPASEGMELVNISDIIRCEAEGSYSTVFLQDGRKLTISRPLIRLAEIMNELNFERIHKKHLINMKYIKKYKKTTNPENILSTGETLPVSNTRRKEFEDSLKSLQDMFCSQIRRYKI